MQNRPIKLGFYIVLSVMVIFGIVYVYSDKITNTYNIISGNTTKIYKNTEIGIFLKYPSNFVLSASTTPDKAAVLDFSSRSNRILFAIFIQDKDFVSRDKLFYESILFKDPNQIKNSHVTFGDYEGFKALITFEQSRYAIYRSLDATSSLVIRAEISASSTDALLDSENVFKSMLSGMTID